MIYTLSYEDIKLKCMFIKDDTFGTYFITELFDNEIKLPKELDITKIDENNLRISLDNLNFKSKKLKIFGKHLYVLSAKNEILDFDDEAINDNILYKKEEIIEILSKLIHLSNGNFMVSSIQDYLGVISELNLKYENLEHFYRGHYCYKFKLIPSLFRNKKYYLNESLIYMDFKSHFYNEFSNKKYIEILTMMQHYKMPTRLLDTSLSPLVALFMATNKPENFNIDALPIGEVIMMNEETKNIKFFDSNLTTLMASLSVLETHYKIELYDAIKESIKKNDRTIYQNTNAYKRFVAEVTSELPKFDESFFDPTVLLKPKHIKVGLINERIIAQSGAFILYGLTDIDDSCDNLLETRTKERIFITNHAFIRKQLEMLNINMAVMFPDMDHTATSITKKFK